MNTSRRLAHVAPQSGDMVSPSSPLAAVPGVRSYAAQTATCGEGSEADAVSTDGGDVDEREQLERQLDEAAAALSDRPFRVLVDVARALERLDAKPASDTAGRT